MEFKGKIKNIYGQQKILLFSTVILFAVTLLAVIVGTLMYRSHLYDLTANQNKVRLSGTQNTIKYGISFGKEIEYYYGLDKKLEQVSKTYEEITGLYIAKENGLVLYSDGTFDYPDTILELLPGEVKVLENSLYEAVEISEGINLIIRGDLKKAKARVKFFFLKLVKLAFAGCAATFALVCIVVWRLKKHSRYTAMLKGIAVLMVLWISLFGYFIGSESWKEYRDSLSVLSDEIAGTVKSDLETLAAFGFSYEELSGKDAYFSDYSDSIEEFSKITLRKAEEQIKGDMVSEFSVAYGNSKKTFKLVCEINKAHIDQMMLQYFLNALLLSVISLLVIMEYKIFLEAVYKKKNFKIAGNKDYLSFMRIIVFIVYACISIGAALNAVVAQKLVLDSYAEGRDMLVGLPTSFHMFFSLIGILCSAYLLNRMKNMKKVVKVSVLLCFIGLILSAFAADIFVFALARGFTGAGNGLLLLSLRNLSTFQETPEERTSAMASMCGGSFAGTCFGSTFGGILAAQFSYRFVFITGAVALISAWFLLLKMEFPVIRGVEKTGKFKNMILVLKNKKAFRYLLFLTMPVFGCTVFMDYVLPLAGNGFGCTTAVISTLILFNSLFAGYAAPFLTKLALKIGDLQKSILFYAIGYAVVILLFVLVPVFWVLGFSVLLLGLLDGYGVSIMSEGFLRMKGDSQYDDATGNIVYTMAGRAGMTIMPFLMDFTGKRLAFSCIVMPVLLVTGVLIFLFGNRTEKVEKR